MTALFVTGIDTEIGKTMACGVLAKTLLQQGFSLYTQKLVETGCEGEVSNDLQMHEKIVGHAFNDMGEDLHCPYRFTTPVSPHLAAEIDGRSINVEYLSNQMKILKAARNHLLIEGAGGLCVPLNINYMLVDFVIEHQLPIVLVTSARLGSINHTMLTLELCAQKNVDVRAIIYNYYPEVSVGMVESTRHVLKEYINQNFGDTLWLDLMKAQEVFQLNTKQIEQLLTELV